VSNLHTMIIDSFMSPASTFMWLSLISILHLLVLIPVLFFKFRSKRSFVFSITASFVPFLLGLCGFVTCILQFNNTLKNIPEAQRVLAYKSGMQLAYSSFWPSILTLVFLILTFVAYRFFSIKSLAENEFEIPGALASRGKRFFGSLIDIFILTILIIPVVMFLMNIGSIKKIDILTQIIISMSGIVIYVALNGYLIIKNGQTIGKNIVGTKIVDYNTNANANLFKVAFIRFGLLILLKPVPIVGNLIGIINPIFIFGKEKRCLHDMFAGTKVVNSN
jgi:uncharacterized RDD family membrane protein YckC